MVKPQQTHGSFGTYVFGFVLSLLLTVLPYLAVTRHLLSGTQLIALLVGLALIQLWVQLVFFLHLNQEQGGHWNLAVLLSTFSGILILIIGSLWIMHNLNYNHGLYKTNQQIIQDEGLSR